MSIIHEYFRILKSTKRVDNIMMNYLKAILVIIILLIGYLYYTRPEMEITPNNFIKTMDNNGYRVFKKPNKDADISYAAVSKDKSILINYAGFKNEAKSKEFYSKITEAKDEKHQLKIKREVYIGKPCPEMQSYTEYEDYYIAIYTKNAVIYSKTNIRIQGNTDDIFNTLFKPVKFDLNTIESMLSSKPKK